MSCADLFLKILEASFLEVEYELIILKESAYILVLINLSRLYNAWVISVAAPRRKLRPSQAISRSLISLFCYIIRKFRLILLVH